MALLTKTACASQLAGASGMNNEISSKHSYNKLFLDCLLQGTGVWASVAATTTSKRRSVFILKKKKTVAVRVENNEVLLRFCRVVEIWCYACHMTLHNNEYWTIDNEPLHINWALTKSIRVVQTECRSLIIHHNVLSPVCTKLGGRTPPPLVDRRPMLPKPKTLSLKPKEKARKN